MASPISVSLSAFSLEWDRSGAFIRLGKRELYARRCSDAAASWAWVRAVDGALEVDAGRFRLTVSRVPTHAVATA